MRGRRRTRVSFSVEKLELRTLLSSGVVRDVNAYESYPKDLVSAGGYVYFVGPQTTNTFPIWAASSATGSEVQVAQLESYPNPGTLVALGSQIYFPGSTGGNQSGLYTTSAQSPGGKLVASVPGGIQPGLVVVGSHIFFEVVDYSAGNDQLWESDGTSSGTHVVSGGAKHYGVDYLTAVGGKVFFTDETNNYFFDLFVSDGSSISLVDTFSWAQPMNLTSLNGELYFQLEPLGTTQVQIWQSDGTAAGTTQLDLGSVVALPGSMAYFNGDLYFNGVASLPPSTEAYLPAPPELYKTDGTAAGTVQLTILSTLSSLYNFTPVGNELLFLVNETGAGWQLWSSDGTGSGTSLLKDINPGGGSFYPTLDSSVQQYNYAPFTVLNGKAYFSAEDGVHGQELWSTDGTSQGTSMVADVNPGPDGSWPHDIVVMGNRIAFAANDGSGGTQVWSSDGTASGTNRIANYGASNTPGSSPTSLVADNGLVYFNATNYEGQTSVYVSDGTYLGTNLVFSGSAQLFNASAGVVLAGSEGSNPETIFITDGSRAGTLAVSDRSSPVESVVQEGGLVYWTQQTVNTGTGQSELELWRTNGTIAGTFLLDTFDLGSSSNTFNALGYSAGEMYFSVTSSLGTNIYSTDGTIAGTSLLSTLSATQWPSGSSGVWFANGYLFTQGNSSGANGYTYWSIDLSTGVAQKVFDSSTLGSGLVNELGVANGRFLFGFVGLGGESVWSSDGTVSGTIQVADFQPLSLGNGKYSDPVVTSEASSAGLMLFVVEWPGQNVQLWSTDGSAAGTLEIQDLAASSTNFGVEGLVVLNGGFLFAAIDPSTSDQALWASNGTASGTSVLVDLPTSSQQGYGSSKLPTSLYDDSVSQGKLFFALAFSPTNEPPAVGLWETDGTLAGTKEIVAGVGSNVDYVVSGNQIFYGDGANPGSELHVYSVPYTGSNGPPTINSIANPSVNQGAALQLIALGTAPGGDPLYFQLQAGPVGLMVGPSSGAITWDVPGSEAPGAYSVTIAAVDGMTGLSSSTTFTINVAAAPQPILNAISDQAVDGGGTTSFTAVAADNDGGTLVFSLVGSFPYGASIDPATGVFTWQTPSNIAEGKYVATVAVEDELSGATTTQAVSIFVYQPPIYHNVSSYDYAGEGRMILTLAHSNDPGIITYSLGSDAPAGASFDSFGDFNWAVPRSQPGGVVSFDATATDSISGLSTTILITLTIYGEPVLDAISSQSVNEGGTLTFTAQATTSDTGSVAFSLSSYAPLGSSIDPDSGVFTWTPTPDQSPGNYYFQVIATDTLTNLFSSTPVTVAVYVPPYLNGINPIVVDEGGTATFTAIATTKDSGAISYSLGATAPPGAMMNASSGAFAWTPSSQQAAGVYTFDVTAADSLSGLSETEPVTITLYAPPVLAPIGALGVPENKTLSFTAHATPSDPGSISYKMDLSAPYGSRLDPSSGVFNWTPTPAQAAEVYSFNVIATDALSGLSSSTAAAITVYAPPVLAPIGSLGVDEGGTLTFNALATSSDTGAVRYSLDASAPTGSTINSSSGMFNWSPTSAQTPGAYTFDVIATDVLSGLSSSAPATVALYAPPVIEPIGSLTVDEGSTSMFTATAQSSDAGGIVFSLAANAPAGATVDAGSGMFSWTPTVAQSPGVYTFNVVATDGISGLASSALATITVYAPPVFSPISTQSVDQGGTLTIDPSAKASDSGTLSYALTGTIPTGASIDASTGLFTWNVSASQTPEAYTIGVSVVDGASNLQSQQAFTVIVYAPPTLASIANTIVDAGSTVASQAVASETDSGSLVYALAPGAPTGASIDAKSGLFSWTTPPGQAAGLYPITVMVLDSASGLSSEQSFSITVFAPPTLDAIGDQTVVEGGAVQVTANAHSSDAGALVYSLASGPPGATIDPNTGVVHYAANVLGTSRMTVNVLDSASGLAATRSFNVNVVLPPVSTIPVFVGGEKLITVGKGRKKKLSGFEIAFNQPIASTTQSALGYSITQLVKKGRKITPLKVSFSTRYDPSGRFVDLLVAGSPKFLLGGQIALNASGAVTLEGGSTFAIPKKA